MIVMLVVKYVAVNPDGAKEHWSQSSKGWSRSDI